MEGLASGPSMAKRWDSRLKHCRMIIPVGFGSPLYRFMISNLILNFSPKRIVLGGGVPQHSGLIEKVRVYVQLQINGYVRSPKILEQIDQLIVSPALGNQAGVMGAIALAKSLPGM